MRRFIFAERSGIYIIDLQKTLRQIGKAQELLKSVVLKGEGVLFVCTKKQLKAIVQAEAEGSSSPLTEKSSSGAVNWIWVPFWIGILGSLFAGAIAIRLRLRRSTGVERLQTLWVAWAAALVPSAC